MPVENQHRTRLGNDKRLIGMPARRGRHLLRGRRHQTVHVDDAGATLEGTVMGLSPDGALRVLTPGADVLEIVLGELILDTGA